MAFVDAIDCYPMFSETDIEKTSSLLVPTLLPI